MIYPASQRDETDWEEARGFELEKTWPESSESCNGAASSRKQRLEAAMSARIRKAKAQIRRINVLFSYLLQRAMLSFAVITKTSFCDVCLPREACVRASVRATVVVCVRAFVRVCGGVLGAPFHLFVG